jgi:hypothetical protein
MAASQYVIDTMDDILIRRNSKEDAQKIIHTMDAFAEFAVLHNLTS